MGIYISSFGLNINEINALFGCRDQKKFTAIKKARTFFNYDDMTGISSPISVTEAVEDFFYNQTHDVPDAVYSCALLMMCDARRISVPHAQRIQFGEQTHLINKCLSEDFHLSNIIKLEELIFSSDCRDVFKKMLFIPKTFARVTDRDSYNYLNSPMISLWSRSRVEEAQQIFARINILDHQIKTLEKSKITAENLKGLAYRNIKDFLLNIDYCAPRKLGMIHFSY